MIGLPLLRSASQLRSRMKSWRAFGESVALVTMVETPHPGHADLIRAAQRHADRVLAALLPPAGQGGEGDAARPEEAAAARLAEEAGADALYAPAAFRPAGFASHIRVAGLSEVLEGEDDPAAFDGFAADMTRLFAQTQPDVAVFCAGRFQRFAVARRLAADFDLCPGVLALELERDDDGVPVCETGLSEAERDGASRLWRGLRRAASAIEAGQDPDETLDAAADALADAGAEVEYLDLRDERTLEEVDRLDPARPARIFAAVVWGDRRIVDNLRVGPEAEAV